MSKIYEKDKLLFRVEVGTADVDGKPVYEMATTVNDMSPLLRCVATGRTFSLSWQDIIDQAEAAGINQEPEGDSDEPDHATSDHDPGEPA